MGLRVFKADPTLEVLVDDLLDLRVKLSLAREARRPNEGLINEVQLEILKLEAEICRRQQTPFPTSEHRYVARQFAKLR